MGLNIFLNLAPDEDPYNHAMAHYGIPPKVIYREEFMGAGPFKCLTCKKELRVIIDGIDYHGSLEESKDCIIMSSMLGDGNYTEVRT